MLDFVKAHRIHLLFVFGGIVAFWWILGTQGVQDCICNQNQNHPNQSPEKYLSVFFAYFRNYMLCLWDAIDRNHDAVIALFTIVIGIFTSLLFVDSREKTRKELRAYLFVTHVSVDKIKVGEIPTSSVQTKNSGLTPAYDVTHRGSMHAVKSVSDLVSWDKLIPTPRINIGPAGTIFHENRFGGVLTEGMMSELIAKKRIFYVFGKITYKDVFGKSHWTIYRTFQDGEGAQIGSNDVIVCEDGNDCDKE